MTEHRYVDGPAFAEWLEPWIDYTHLPESQKRMIRRLRAGERASFDVVDALLCAETELSTWDIPDEVWVAHGNCRFPRRTQQEAIKRVERGEGCRAVARALGVDHRTIRRWMRGGIA